MTSFLDETWIPTFIIELDLKDVIQAIKNEPDNEVNEIALKEVLLKVFKKFTEKQIKLMNNN